MSCRHCSSVSMGLSVIGYGRHFGELVGVLVDEGLLLAVSFCVGDGVVGGDGSGSAELGAYLVDASEVPVAVLVGDRLQDQRGYFVGGSARRGIARALALGLCLCQRQRLVGGPVCLPFRAMWGSR